jgi:hypothetical protein
MGNPFAGNPGRMTFSPVASHQLASAVCGGPVGDVVMREFDERIEYETFKLVTPPAWSLGGRVDRELATQRQRTGEANGHGHGM